MSMIQICKDEGDELEGEATSNNPLKSVLPVDSGAKMSLLQKNKML